MEVVFSCLRVARFLCMPVVTHDFDWSVASETLELLKKTGSPNKVQQEFALGIKQCPMLGPVLMECASLKDHLKDSLTEFSKLVRSCTVAMNQKDIPAHRLALTALVDKVEAGMFKVPGECPRLNDRATTSIYYCIV